MGLAELTKMKAECEAKIQAEGKSILRDEFKVFFDAHPTVTKVRWTQYTPYFNDGDECVFTVHADCELAFGDDDELQDAWDRKDRDAVAPIYKAARQLVDGVPDEVMEAVFGDHAEITATRDGFDVEEYQHD